MKFGRGCASAVFAAALLTLSVRVHAQAPEELLQDQDIPNNRPPGAPNGLFDDQLEPLDDNNNAVRPGPQGNPQAPRGNIVPPNGENSNNAPEDFGFPEPHKPISKPSGLTRSLPPLPGAPGDIPRPNEKVRMDFVQVEIEDIVKYFAERLKKKFIYDPSIFAGGGKVTIISPTEVTLAEAWGAFLSAMEVRGYIIFPVNKYIKVEKAANARKSPVPIYTGQVPNDDQYVTRILTLKYLSVNDIRQAVRNLLSRTGGDVIEHLPTNTLIISDYAFNIRRIVRILDILDVPSFQEQIAVLKLKYASANDVVRQIHEFFPSSGAGGGGYGGPGAPPTAFRPAGMQESGQQSVINKVVGDERTNSLIVLGSEHGIEQVKKFIAQIDVPIEGGGGQIHIYRLENVKAADISQTLANLASGTAAGAKKSSGGSSGPTPNIPGLIPTPPPAASAGSAGAVGATLGDVKITADEGTNSLLIQSSNRDYENLKNIIKLLDIRRKQVFIESAILSVTVNRGSNIGVSGGGPLFQTNKLATRGGGPDGNGVTQPSAGVGILNGLGLTTLLANPTALQGLALGFQSSKNFTVPVQGPNGPTNVTVPLLSAVLQLAATDSNINILSTPHILATANVPASILIGQTVQQQGSTTVTTAGTPINSATYTPLNTELDITPQISTGDYVTLEIQETIDEPGATDPKTGIVLSTVNRKAKTTAIVKDQQTIVMGGLMKDEKDVNVSKVPFLGDIPVLGWLFSNRTTTIVKQNLLLFITPHIIKDTADMNDTFFKKLKERVGFLKEIGATEKPNAPISSGLTQEQLQMLDPEYLKSIGKEQQKSTYKREESKPTDQELSPEVPEVPPTPEAQPSEAQPTENQPGEMKEQPKSDVTPLQPETPPLPATPPAPADKNAPNPLPPAPTENKLPEAPTPPLPPNPAPEPVAPNLTPLPPTNSTPSNPAPAPALPPTNAQPPSELAPVPQAPAPQAPSGPSEPDFLPPSTPAPIAPAPLPPDNEGGKLKLDDSPPEEFKAPLPTPPSKSEFSHSIHKNG